MLKFFPAFLLLFLIIVGCTQKPNKVYRFNLADDNTPFSKADADSCITILKNRLKSADYKNSLISYDASQRQFTVKVVSQGDDDFIKDGLVNQCEVYFTEMYSLQEISEVWKDQPTLQDSISKYLSFTQSYQPDYSSSYTPYIGVVLMRDTTDFSSFIYSFKSNFPEDCFFAYPMKVEPKAKGIEVYAYKKNERTIYVNKCLQIARQDFDVTGHPCIKFQLTPYGADRFARITRANVAKPVGILVNGKMCSAPFVNGEVLGGNAEINGNFTIAEAQEIAANLNSGNLPVKLLLEK